MPTDMTRQETETHVNSGAEVDRYDYRNPEDSDDYISAVLYRATTGRHFRHVEMSGMNSVLAGASGFGEWLTEEELANWTEF